MRNYFLALLLLIFNSCNESLNYNLKDGEVDKDYLFNSKNTKWFPKNYDLYKSQYRPMRKGVTNMIRLQATNAVAMPTEIRLHILASSKDVIHS